MVWTVLFRGILPRNHRESEVNQVLISFLTCPLAETPQTTVLYCKYVVLSPMMPFVYPVDYYSPLSANVAA